MVSDRNDTFYLHTLFVAENVRIGSLDMVELGI